MIIMIRELELVRGLRVEIPPQKRIKVIEKNAEYLNCNISRKVVE